MKQRRPLSIHAVGEKTGTGEYRSLCNAGMVTGPYRSLVVDPSKPVNCERCLRRMGEVTQGD